MLKIKEFPLKDRPRERLKDYGANALSNSELLAIILRTGTKNETVIELAHRILFNFNHISDFKHLTYDELLMINGIGNAKASEILAIIELGKRIHKTYQEEYKEALNPKDVYEYLKQDLSHLMQEHFVCLFLDSKSRIKAKKTLFIGSLNQTLIHPREIFNAAIKHSAAAIIIAHNHPSGDSTPSKADIDITLRLEEIGKLVGIDILDHIIIGKNQYLSLKEKGLF